MKKPLFISVQPTDNLFLSELRVQLNNFRKFNYSDNYHVLLFEPQSRLNMPNPEVQNMVRDFPETQFYLYKDTSNLERLFKVFDYIPILRPWCLQEHYKKFPELSEQTVFYLDADVIFTKQMSFEEFKQDKSYCSRTKYIDGNYLQKKREDVIPSRLDLFDKVDIINEMAKICGITKDTILDNIENTGGAQYILNGVDSQFWTDVFNNSIELRMYLKEQNQRFFQGETALDRENKGFQSWCADMWAVLFNLWRRNIRTECPKSLDFAWATDPISKWEEVNLYHDAGYNGVPLEVDGKVHRLYYKNNENYKHIWNNPNIRTPFQDNLDWVSKDYCSWKYVENIQDSKQTIK